MARVVNGEINVAPAGAAHTGEVSAIVDVPGGGVLI
jgi:hypothetical protein